MIPSRTQLVVVVVVVVDDDDCCASTNARRIALDRSIAPVLAIGLRARATRIARLESIRAR